MIAVKRKFLRKRAGMTLPEILLVVFIAAIALVALLQTTATSSHLLIATRQDIAANTLAAAWFEQLETFDVNAIITSRDATLEKLAIRIDPSHRKGSGNPYLIHGFEVAVGYVENTSENFATINLEVSPLGRLRTEALKFSRSLNLISNQTVDNDWRD